MSIEVKDITQLEFYFTSWMPVDVNDLDNADLWFSGRVKKYWLKNCTLYMELDDDTIVEEDLSDFEIWQDYKRHTKTMVEVNDKWEKVK